MSGTAKEKRDAAVCARQLAGGLADADDFIRVQIFARQLDAQADDLERKPEHWRYDRAVPESGGAPMDRTPDPIPLAKARQLPWQPGRSAEAFVDGDLEVRFTPRPTNGPQTPHQRDEVYVIAAGSGFYRVEGKRTGVSAGDMCFAAAHAPHGFEDFTDDFAIWVIFYGPVK